MSGTSHSQEKFDKLQKFTVKRIHRSRLLDAPYNPRKINDRQRKALKKSLEDNGLLQPLVWNEATGNMVGGHQRLSQLDSIMRTDDYELDIAVVNLSEQEEIKANMVLNNQSLMGDFDFAKVNELANKFEFDLGADFLFDRDDMLVSFNTPKEETDIIAPPRTIEADEATIQAIKDRKKEVRAKYKEIIAEDSGEVPDIILQVIFIDAKTKASFLENLELDPETKMIAAQDLFDIE